MVRRYAVSLDVVGINYCPKLSVFDVIREDDRIIQQPVWGGSQGLKNVIQAYYRRYRRPIWITETSTNQKVGNRVQWLTNSVEAVGELRSEGIPVIGYTWWPLYDLVNTGKGRLRQRSIWSRWNCGGL
ncbi:MAG: glycosyl hydrolase [Firmicutes bacterium]|uniref:Glycosyl hydrolase family 1 n=1 Tax=Melghirimyces thermohalophilus TaxID=1236220 RepID=A0A1G6MWL4_9BACL|nr:glycosyl hydrolase [Melghirimyces thermohalophilus]MDA8352946.1 glycosyl hydrolase [Bacillota bacterium]SDC59960.1 Glycosyl hydrolase family 1 [Melghirimyces thermohalophilus]